MGSVGLLNSSLGALWMQLGSTVLVLAMIAGAAFFAVRFLKPKMGIGASDSRMKVIEKLPLEPRRSLYLVRVDDKEMVVGVTEAGVSMVSQNPLPGGGPKTVQKPLPQAFPNGSPNESSNESPKESDNAGE